MCVATERAMHCAQDWGMQEANPGVSWMMAAFTFHDFCLVLLAVVVYDHEGRPHACAGWG